MASSVAELRGVRPVVGEVRAGDRDLDRRRRAEAHDLAHDVGRLEREPHVGHLARERLAEPLLEALDGDARPRLQGDAEHDFLGPARPLVDGVDRIARRDDADVADRDLDVLRPTSCRSSSSAAMRDLLGLLDPRAGRGPDAELEPAGVDLGKDLQPEPRARHDDHKRRDDQ